MRIRKHPQQELVRNASIATSVRSQSPSTIFSLVSDWISEPKARAIFENCLGEMNKHVTEQVVLNDVFIGFWGDFPVIKVIQMFGQTWLVDRSPDDVVEEMIADSNGNKKEVISLRLM